MNFGVFVYRYLRQLVAQAIHMNLALERLVERHIGLRTRHSLHMQNLVEDGTHQMLVVDAVELDHQVV